jgi:hypothetical protein
VHRRWQRPFLQYSLFVSVGHIKKYDRARCRQIFHGNAARERCCGKTLSQISRESVLLNVSWTAKRLLECYNHWMVCNSGIVPCRASNSCGGSRSMIFCETPSRRTESPQRSAFQWRTKGPLWPMDCVTLSVMCGILCRRIKGPVNCLSE